MQDCTHDERSDMASENNRHVGVSWCCAQTKQSNMAERSQVTLLDVFKDTCRDFQLICGVKLAFFHRKSDQLHPIKWFYLKSNQDHFFKLSKCFFAPEQNQSMNTAMWRERNRKKLKLICCFAETYSLVFRPQPVQTSLVSEPFIWRSESEPESAQ